MDTKKLKKRTAPLQRPRHDPRVSPEALRTLQLTRGDDGVYSTSCVANPGNDFLREPHKGPPDGKALVIEVRALETEYEKYWIKRTSVIPSMIRKEAKLRELDRQLYNVWYDVRWVTNPKDRIRIYQGVRKMFENGWTLLDRLQMEQLREKLDINDELVDSMERVSVGAPSAKELETRADKLNAKFNEMLMQCLEWQKRSASSRRNSINSLMPGKSKDQEEERQTLLNEADDLALKLSKEPQYGYRRSVELIEQVAKLLQSPEPKNYSDADRMLTLWNAPAEPTESELMEGLTYTRFAMARLKTVHLSFAPRRFNVPAAQAEVGILFERYAWSPFVQAYVPRTDKHLSRPCREITVLAVSAAHAFLQSIDALDSSDSDVVSLAALEMISEEQRLPRVAKEVQRLLKAIKPELPQVRLEIAESKANRLLNEMVAEFSVTDFHPPDPSNTNEN